MIAQTTPSSDNSRRTTLAVSVSTEKPITERIVEYVDENYMLQISLRDVAEHFGYSACHLTHIFSRSKGMPITAWIVKRRILAAKVLLSEGTVNVATACEAVGFNDLCYFTRQFVRHVGLTPGRYRVAMKNRKNPERKSPRYADQS